MDSIKFIYRNYEGLVLGNKSFTDNSKEGISKIIKKITHKKNNLISVKKISINKIPKDVYYTLLLYNVIRKMEFIDYYICKCTHINVYAVSIDSENYEINE